MKDYMESQKSNQEPLTEEKLKEIIDNLYWSNPVNTYNPMVLYGGSKFQELFDKALRNAIKPRDPKTGRYIKYKK